MRWHGRLHVASHNLEKHGKRLPFFQSDFRELKEAYIEKYGIQKDHITDNCIFCDLVFFKIYLMIFKNLSIFLIRIKQNLIKTQGGEVCWN